ncbi:MAG: cell division protein SepF [Candidatus Eremiobacteraeota bacterium]|nr:cell division protein SepF [Candidatus Eremiobacteraeota bacterium]
MASGIIERIRKFLAMESDEMELSSVESVEYRNIADGVKSYKEDPMRESTRMRGMPGVKQEIVVFQPGTFGDAQQVAEHIKARKTVIINMKRTEKELGKRIIDFLSGINYAVDGNVQKIADNIFVFTPAHIDVTMIHEVETAASESPLFNR